MIFEPSVPPICQSRAARVGVGIVIRVTLACAAVSLALVSAFAAEPVRLRSEVIAKTEIVTVADLLEGVSGPAARKALFRAPALGETGTIQVHRIADAVSDLGFGPLETGGRGQVVVQRAARRVGTLDIEGAVRKALELHHGVDTRSLQVSFDGTPPSLFVDPEVKEAVTAEDVTYDRRTHRFTALAAVGAPNLRRRTTIRVTGTVVEVVEVAVLARALARGESVQAADLITERRTRESVPADAQLQADLASGQVARRALPAGTVLRTGDLVRPEIVGRGDIVTVTYEVPGLTLTLRGKATEAGALGDSIGVTNLTSKRVLQAQIIAPGQVRVGPAAPGPLAANALPAQP